MLISAVGGGLFIYGIKAVRFVHMIVGVILCIYPYFVPNLLAMSLIAVILIVGLVYASRMGI